MGVNHQATHACLGPSWQRSPRAHRHLVPLDLHSWIIQSPNEENSAGALGAVCNMVGQVMYDRHQLVHHELLLCPGHSQAKYIPDQSVVKPLDLEDA